MKFFCFYILKKVKSIDINSTIWYNIKESK